MTTQDFWTSGSPASLGSAPFGLSGVGPVHDANAIGSYGAFPRIGGVDLFGQPSFLSLLAQTSNSLAASQRSTSANLPQPLPGRGGGANAFLDGIADRIARLETSTQDQRFALDLNDLEGKVRGAMLGGGQPGALRDLSQAIDALVGRAASGPEKDALAAIGREVREKLGERGRVPPGPRHPSPGGSSLDGLADRVGRIGAAADPALAQKLNGIEGQIRRLGVDGETPQGLKAAADALGAVARDVRDPRIAAELNAIERALRLRAAQAPQPGPQPTPQPAPPPPAPAFKRPEVPPFPSVAERKALPDSQNHGVNPDILRTEGWEKATLTFQGDNAGYSNSLIAYQIGEDGSVSNARVVIANSDTIAKGTEIDLGTFPPGARIGFALVSNGAKNGIDGAGAITFTGQNGQPFNVNDGAPPKVVFQSAGGAREITAPVYFTSDKTAGASNPINDGGVGQFVAGSIGKDSYRFGAEDIQGGGDKDMNDLIFDVRFTKTTPPPGTPTPGDFYHGLADRIAAYPFTMPWIDRQADRLDDEVRALAGAKSPPTAQTVEPLAKRLEDLARFARNDGDRAFLRKAADDLRAHAGAAAGQPDPVAPQPQPKPQPGGGVASIVADLNRLASQTADKMLSRDLRTLAQALSRLGNQPPAGRGDALADRLSALVSVASRGRDQNLAIGLNDIEGRLRRLLN